MVLALIVICVLLALVLAATALRRAPKESRVFVSYRRSDSRDDAKALFDRLNERMPGRIFFDRYGLESAAGTPYPDALRAALARASDLLVVIGPSWAAGDNHRRLAESEDWVRAEALHGLGKCRRCVPVLVGDAKLPKTSDLPEPLRPLLERQAFSVSPQWPDRDVQRLGDYLLGRPERWFVPNSVLYFLTLAALGWGCYWYMNWSGDSVAVVAFILWVVPVLLSVSVWLWRDLDPSGMFRRVFSWPWLAALLAAFLVSAGFVGANTPVVTIENPSTFEISLADLALTVPSGKTLRHPFWMQGRKVRKLILQKKEQGPQCVTTEPAWASVVRVAPVIYPIAISLLSKLASNWAVERGERPAVKG